MLKFFGYQARAYRKVVEAFKRQLAVLILMATGLGKTVMATHFAKDELEAKPNGKGIFLCHDTGILNQAYKKFEEAFGPNLAMNKFYGKEKKWDFNAQVVFASFQSMEKWTKHIGSDYFEWKIVDEAHHSEAPSYGKVLDHFEGIKTLAVTATDGRMDGLKIQDRFGKEVVRYTLPEALAKGWLTPIEYHVMSDFIDDEKLNKIVRNVKENGERVSIQQLNSAIFIEKRDKEIAESMLKHAKGKKTLVFCKNKKHAQIYKELLPGSDTFHSGHTDAKNDNTLQRFRDGEIDYLLTIGKFNEGMDVPDVEVIVFLRDTESQIVFLQQLGRGLRKIPGKDKVIVLDYVGNCNRLWMIKKLGDEINEFLPKSKRSYLGKDHLHVTGKAFDFVFNDKEVDILRLITRAREEFYATYEEASRAAIKLGIKSSEQYTKIYKKDRKLPSCPKKYYLEFTDWISFLAAERKDFYSSWKEASKAAVALGIKNQRDYYANYSQDSRLPSRPRTYYENFPGFDIFLAKEGFYSTWEEASEAAIGLKIKNQRDYHKKHHKDPRLPSNPQSHYGKFPGFGKFLGH